MKASSSMWSELILWCLSVFAQECRVQTADKEALISHRMQPIYWSFKTRFQPSIKKEKIVTSLTSLVLIWPRRVKDLSHGQRFWIKSMAWRSQDIIQMTKQIWSMLKKMIMIWELQPRSRSHSQILKEMKSRMIKKIWTKLKGEWLNNSKCLLNL